MDRETPTSSPATSQGSQRERSLEFITFTNPEMVRTATARRRVRSLAMREVHRRPASERRRRNEIELDISSLPLRATTDTQTHATTEQSMALFETAVSSTLPNALSASRLDPFFQYPITMGRRERELYDHRQLNFGTIKVGPAKLIVGSL
jgi:hypothetical protein